MTEATWPNDISINVPAPSCRWRRGLVPAGLINMADAAYLAGALAGNFPSGREEEFLTIMLDLFNAPALPGLSLTSDLVTNAEEQALTAAIDAADLTPFRFHGWIGKRLTVSYGWTYDFGAGHLRPSDPLPDWLVPFRDRAARFARLPTDELVQALLIRYDPGVGIGWHKDGSVFEHVVGVSLGASATMRFRRRRGERFERVNVPLEPRGAYHLSGASRHEWEHSIAGMDHTRWSVTFRGLADRAK